MSPVKRRRRRARKHGTATLVVAVAAAALISYRSSLALAVALAAVAGGLAVAAVVLRHHPVVRQVMQAPKPASARVSSKPPKAISQPADRTRPGGRRHARRPGRTSDFGDLIPSRKTSRLVSVSEECAGDQHLVCSAPNVCGCGCSHDPATIAAAYRDRYDQAAAAANGSAEPQF